MKLKFLSCSNREWVYDINTGKVTPYVNDCATENGERLCDGNFFRSKSSLSLDEIEKSFKESECLILNVTEGCSNRCKYCIFGGAYVSGRHHSPAVLKIEDAERAIDYLFTLSKKVDLISFYGGEPMFNEGMEIIKKVVAYVKTKYPDREVAYSLTTNGNHLTRENIDFLAQHNFIFSVSLDGPKEIQDRYRRTIDDKPTFDGIMRNLKILQENYPEYYRKNVRFVSVLTPPLEYEKRRTFFVENELTKGHDIALSSVLFDGQSVFSQAEINQYMSDYREMVRAFAKQLYRDAVEGRDVSQTFEFKFFRRELANLHKWQTVSGDTTIDLDLLGCCVPGYKIFVSTKGEFYTCEKMCGSYPIGDLEAGLSAEKVKELMDDYHSKQGDMCLLCPYAKVCSLCYVSALDDSLKFSKSILEGSCYERRSFYKLVLRLYAGLHELFGAEGMAHLFVKTEILPQVEEC